MMTWTTRAFIGPNAITQSVSFHPVKPNTVAVLLITPHFSASAIERLHQTVYGQTKPQILVGAVVDSLYGRDTPAWTLSTSDRLKQATGFHIQRPRLVSHRSVGRWPDSTSRNGWFESSDPHRSNSLFESLSQPPMQSDLLPKHLVECKDYYGYKQGSKPVMMMLTDDEPLQTIRSLNDAFPEALKVGLVASRTPFLNGKPFTLFSNDAVVNSGSVGLCWNQPDDTLSADIDQSDYKPISGSLVISKAKGNIISELNHDNATKSLFDPIDKKKLNSLTADGRVVVRLTDPRTGQSGIYGLSGGDMARGTLAVDTSVDIIEGMEIQVLGKKHHSDDILSKSSVSVSFECISMSEPSDASQIEQSDFVCDSIVAGSELGVIYSDPSKKSLGGYHLCNVPHAKVQMNL